jgi:hypothetical protein
MRFQLHWFSFILGFSVMMLYNYMILPKPKVMVKFPNPYNAGKIIYHDAVDTCFVFDAIEVEKKKDDGLKIKKQPIMEKFANENRVNHVRRHIT